MTRSAIVVLERCSTCAEEREYPAGFPDPDLAQCWACAWGQHMVKAHPVYAWRVWRRARLAAIASHPATETARPRLRAVPDERREE